MVPEAEWFLKTLEKLGAEKTGSDKYKNLPCKAENGKVSYPLLTGKTLHQEIAELAHEGKPGSSKDFLRISIGIFSSPAGSWITERKSSVRYLENIPEEQIMNVSALPMWI